MYDLNYLREKVKGVMEVYGYSISDVANQIGKTYNCVRRLLYSKNYKEPTAYTIYDISKVIRVGIDSLVDDEYYCFSLDYIKNVYLKLSNKEKEFAKTFILFCSNRTKEEMSVIEKLFW